MKTVMVLHMAVTSNIGQPTEKVGNLNEKKINRSFAVTYTGSISGIFCGQFCTGAGRWAEWHCTCIIVFQHNL